MQTGGEEGGCSGGGCFDVVDAEEGRQTQWHGAGGVGDRRKRGARCVSSFNVIFCLEQNVHSFLICTLHRYADIYSTGIFCTD